MGFYHPSTVVKDAQRHGLKALPVDVTQSEWLCTLEAVGAGQGAMGREQSGGLPFAGPKATPWKPTTLEEFSISSSSRGERFAMRLGLRYVRGLREDAAKALLQERARAPFRSIQDLVERVPELRVNEWQTLAEIGALNALELDHAAFSIQESARKRLTLADPVMGADSDSRPMANGQQPTAPMSPCSRDENHQRLTLKLHRRDALWQVQRAVRRPGPLLEGLVDQESGSPLARMDAEERLVADFRGTGLTVGPHPMAYRRPQMNALGVRRAIELPQLQHGKRVRVAGCIIARQRPGTARGFVFLSLEDETGVANAIITPDIFEKNRITLIRERFLMVEGQLQNSDNLVSVKAERIFPVNITAAETESHDFH